jgi:hypothetical protein
MTKRISIYSFPQDNVVRVLYRYGGLQKNNSPTGASISIHVLLAEIDENRPSIKNKIICTYVELQDLHKATIGSVWEGQFLKSHEFRLSSRIQNKYFVFDMENHPPININFDLVKMHFKDNNDPEITNYFNLTNAEIINQNTIYKIENFNKLNYAKLKSTKNHNVFISSIDILNTLFSRNLKIKESILYKSASNIVNDHFENFISLKKNKYCYKTTIRTDIKKPSENTINFIAALAYNKQVQKNLLTLQSSLEDINYNLFNYRDAVRFPIILPPQTGQLIIKVQGFSYYYDFYVTKIKSVVNSSYHTRVLHQYNKDSSQYYNSLYLSE